MMMPSLSYGMKTVAYRSQDWIVAITSKLSHVRSSGVAGNAVRLSPQDLITAYMSRLRDED